jgi:hypothetical protein
MSKALFLTILGVVFLSISGCASQVAQPLERVKAPDAVSPFERARKEEVVYAERVRNKLEEIFRTGKGANSAFVEPLTLAQSNFTDKSSGKTRSVAIFDTLVYVMPLALRGTPVGEQVNAQIKEFANKMADERGASSIQFSLQSADAKANGIKFETATVDSPKGNPVTVSRAADKNVSKGMQKVMIIAKPIADTLLTSTTNTIEQGCKLENLLGRWEGSFHQDTRTGNFYVILDSLRNGVIVGHSEEEDIRLFRSGNVRAEWTGSVIDGVLTLVKRYPVQGAASIEYRGECSSDNGQISGNWVINAWTKGKFSMFKRELK